MLTFLGKHGYYLVMTKREAVSLFGTPRLLADALLVTPQAIYQWPEKLGQEQADRVTGAALRLGKLPAGYKSKQAAA